MRLRLPGAFVALVALACQPAAPAAPAAEPPVPQSVTCGQVVARDLAVGNDLACPKDGLVAGADGITIDLAGHTLTGPGIGEQTWPNPNLSSVGVKVQGRKNVIIRNGHLAAFATNILIDASSSVTVEGIDSRRSRYGIYFLSTNDSIARGNVFEANVYGLHLQRSNNNQILDNQMARQTYNSPGGYGLYAFASRGNRIVGNTIEANLNWGIWLSDARDNVFFHNNVVGNNPQVSDNTGANKWHDPEKKEGNYWSDYGGLDRNGDGIGDSSYQIGGPGDQLDPYPFIERDGWKKKTSATIDAYVPPPPKARRGVKLLALAGGSLAAASPSDPRATMLAGLEAVASVALAPDEHTVYTLVSGDQLVVFDAATGRLAIEQRFAARPGVLVANRDGRQAIVVGDDGALAIDVKSATERRLAYAGEPRDAVASWKHNMLFVSTTAGLDVFYLGNTHGVDGHVPYTIPLGGAGGVLAMNRSGTRIYVAARGAGVIDVVDTEQYRIIDRIPVPWESVALAVSANEDTFYVAAHEGVIAIDLDEKSRLGSAFFLGTPVDLGVSPNGDQLYVALDGLARGIAVLDANELRTSNFVRVDGSLTKLIVTSY